MFVAILSENLDVAINRGITHTKSFLSGVPTLCWSYKYDKFDSTVSNSHNFETVVNTVKKKFVKKMKLLALLVVLMAVFGVIYAHERQPNPLRPVCACPRNMDPYCGSDLVTYNNKCELDCVVNSGLGRSMSLKMLHRGACPSAANNVWFVRWNGWK